MRIAYLLILTIILTSCKQKTETSSLKVEKPLEDNLELMKIYEQDQADRKGTGIDWQAVKKKDSLRRVRVYQLLDSNKVRTSKDYLNAAMVFQHGGGDSASYGMAVKMMKKCIELDSTANKWLLAAATDRYLLSKGESQIYGTQFFKIGDDPWQRSQMDTTKISDEERIKFGVETLAQQQEKLRKLNEE